MTRKAFRVFGFSLVVAMLVLSLGYVHAQTPGQIPLFDQPGTGVCNSSVGGNDCIDSVISQDASGRIGIGTATPSGALHIVTTTPNDRLIFESGVPNGNPRIVVRANTPAGVAALEASRADLGANASLALSTGSPASTDWDIRTNPASYNLSFLAQGGAERLTVTQSGNVGIGTAPAFKLDVAGSVHASSFPTSSDIRFKTNITPLTGVLQKLQRIRGVSFEWNERYMALGRSTGHKEIGLVAQEVETVFPELVTKWGDEGYRAVDYGRLTSVLVEAIKEQQQQIRDLRAQNSDLSKRLEALERLVTR